MADVSSSSTSHVRSSSLPSNAHPLVVTIEEQLSRLKASKETSSSTSHRLGGLKELYERVDDLIHLPLTKQALGVQQLEEVLDGSLKLLDLCGIARDVFSRMRESVLALESSLRRRSGGESGLASEVRAFMVTRKELNKMICQCLKNLKGMNQNCKLTVLEKDSEMVAVVSILREAEEISLSVFESLLSSLSLPKPKSVVSKLLHSKREEVEATEAEKVDAELSLIKSGKDIKLGQVQKLLKGLDSFQSTIKETEEELECVFRRLLKTRVSLLNILNN
ncbi:hypothetical protein COLO4_21597 [Corchorus olitorius]|uniref:Uncharacterized protein n=1 Tax=Corchorus olitorius TaxID=93759 RepID=A0A1R3ISD2_9ROSI|nr:hypothetical protein COLO4_21597 [Corchorus olitorius]